MTFYTITYIDNSQIVGPSQEAIQDDSERTRWTGVKTLLGLKWRSRKWKETFGDSSRRKGYEKRIWNRRTVERWKWDSDESNEGEEEEKKRRRVEGGIKEWKQKAKRQLEDFSYVMYACCSIVCLHFMWYIICSQGDKLYKMVVCGGCSLSLFELPISMPVALLQFCSLDLWISTTTTGFVPCLCKVG